MPRDGTDLPRRQRRVAGQRDVRRVDQGHAVLGQDVGQAVRQACLRLRQLAGEEGDLAGVEGKGELVRRERAPPIVIARPARDLLRQPTPNVAQRIPVNDQLA
ncbi:MAG: hypothetical protein NTU91_17555 [Chloroflexi bacterium]|nr:hypothetical protein [Chloroflexota bacterium]